MHRGQIPFAQATNPVCTGVRYRLHGKKLCMRTGQTPYAQGSIAVCKAKISICTEDKPRMHRGQMPFARQKSPYARGPNPVCMAKSRPLLSCKRILFTMHTAIFHVNTPIFLHACGAGPLCKAIFPGLHAAKYTVQTGLYHRAYNIFPRAHEAISCANGLK